MNYKFVRRAGSLNLCVIATGNQEILIRCAEHHPADQVAMFDLLDWLQNAAWYEQSILLTSRKIAAGS